MSQNVKHRFALGVLCTLLGGALWGFSGACLQKLLAKSQEEAK